MLKNLVMRSSFDSARLQTVPLSATNSIRLQPLGTLANNKVVSCRGDSPPDTRSYFATLAIFTPRELAAYRAIPLYNASAICLR